ncbi:hypothetical protein ACTXT7_002857 [Hymenolepis weldensis]
MTAYQTKDFLSALINSYKPSDSSNMMTQKKLRLIELGRLFIVPLLLPKPPTSITTVGTPPPNVTLAPTQPTQQQFNLSDFAILLAAQKNLQGMPNVTPIPLSRSNLQDDLTSICSSLFSSASSGLQLTSQPLPPPPPLNRSDSLLKLLNNNNNQTETGASVPALGNGAAVSNVLLPPSSYSPTESNKEQSITSPPNSPPSGSRKRKRRSSSGANNNAAVPRKRSNITVSNQLTESTNQQAPNLNLSPNISSPSQLHEMATRVLIVTLDWLKRCGPLEQLPTDVQAALIAFSWVDLFILGLCQMFGRSLSITRIESLAPPTQEPAKLVRPDFNTIISDFFVADVSAEEFTYLRYMSLFNSGGVTSLDANGVDKVRAIEQKVQGEFAVFLTENDSMKNDPKITPKTFGLRVSTRALKLLGLVNGLRRIHSDDIGRVFFKGESGPNVYSCHFKENIFGMSESDFVSKISGLRNNIGCDDEDHFSAYEYGYALNEKLSSIVELKTEPG